VTIFNTRNESISGFLRSSDRNVWNTKTHYQTYQEIQSYFSARWNIGGALSDIQYSTDKKL